MRGVRSEITVRPRRVPITLLAPPPGELGLDETKLNVNGGAIALGHPLGCTGAKLTAPLLHELRRRGGRYGIVTMCIGGGVGAAGLLEANA